MKFEQYLPETIIDISKNFGMLTVDDNKKLEWSSLIEEISAKDFFIYLDQIESESGIPLFKYN